MSVCPEPGELVEAAIGRVLTQYRESPNLLDLMRAFLSQAEEAVIATCAIPSFFDIETAVGEQLTLVGKRLGFGRCHCVCEVEPVFGFECEGVIPGYPILGFCDENTWLNCGVTGISEICINDDETYRGFLLARRYQMLALYDRDSLTAALGHIWGPTAVVMDDGVGRVVMAPGRILTDADVALLQLVPRVLPVAPGIRQRFHFNAPRVFGFGEGWGGFCEAWEPSWPGEEGSGDGGPEDTGERALMTEDGDLILGANDDGEGEEGEGEGEGETFLILTGPLTKDAPWMCEVDVMPYDCAGGQPFSSLAA